MHLKSWRGVLLLVLIAIGTAASIVSFVFLTMAFYKMINLLLILFVSASIVAIIIKLTQQ